MTSRRRPTVATTAVLIMLAGPTLASCANDQATVSPAEPVASSTGDRADVGNADPTQTPEPTPTVPPEGTTTAPPQISDPGPTRNWPTAELSERGLLTKDTGELAGFMDESGASIFELTITEIAVDFPCEGPRAEESELGHFIGIHLVVETYGGLAAAEDGLLRLTPALFGIRDDSGVTVQAEDMTLLCLPIDTEFPSSLPSNTQAEGWIVLDTEVSSGFVTLHPDPTDSAGWEWPF